MQAETVTSLRRYGEQIRVAELARAGRMLNELTTAERRAVEQMTAAIVRELLYAPANRADGGHGAALRFLFGLDDAA